MAQDVLTIGCSRAVTLTTSDTLNISDTTSAVAKGPLPYARKLRVLAAGTVRLTTTGGDVRNYTVAAGDLIDWVETLKVWQTGTTATLEALY